MNYIMLILVFVFSCVAWQEGAAIELKVNYASGEGCGVILNEFNKSTEIGGGIDKKFFNQVNKYMKVVYLDDNVSINIISQSYKNKVYYYRLDINSDGSDEIVLETRVRVGRGNATNREYYLIKRLDAKKLDTPQRLEGFLDKLSWLNEIGLDYQRLVESPLVFDIDGEEFDITNKKPFLIEVKSKYYLLFKTFSYIYLLNFDENMNVKKHCMFEKIYKVTEK